MRRKIVDWLVLGVGLMLCLGAAASAQGEDAEAEDIVRRIWEEVVAQGDPADEKQLRTRFMEALLRELGPEHPFVLRLMANAAFELYKQGDYSGAQAAFEELLPILRRVLGAEHPDTLTVMNNFAGMLFEQGEYVRAQERFEEVLEIRRRVLGPEHPDTLTAMGNLADTLFKQGDFTRAREILEEVSETLRRVLGPEHPNTLTAMANLASTRAREMGEEVLETRRRVLGREHPDTLVAMSNLAETLHSQKDLDGARRLYEELLDIRRSIFGPDHAPGTVEEFSTLNNLAHVFREDQKLEEAADLFLQALDVLEAQTARAGDSEDIKSTFKVQYESTYRTALKTFLDLERTSEALHIQERFRAQSFLRMLSRRDLLISELPEELEERRRNLAIRYDQSLQKLDRLLTARDEAGIAALRKEQRDLHRERERIQAEIRRISPRLAELENPRPLTVQEIRQALDPGTLMLSYSVGSDRTDLFVLSADGKLESHPLPVRVETLWPQIRLFYRQLQGSAKEFAASRNAMGKWLYEKLIPPAVSERVAQSERLLIIPDGPLHYFPYAALVRTTDDGKEQYLIEWKPVHTALSATVYAHLRNERPVAKPADRPRPLQLAGFGNPSYPGADDGNGRLGLVRSAVDRGLFDGLVPLPHSGREVTTIGGLYPEEAAQTWVGHDATEERAKALGKNVRIVHFAVHGLADPEDPLDSFLAFTIPGQPAEGRDNGLLQAWEIFERVRLDADLVVLSACQTALGPRRGGEGLISLSRAFQYAGARTVAASLWSVSDPSTAELMIRFYRHLQGGKPKDEALRAAQIELIRGGPIEVVDENGERVEEDFSAPYHWAAFQLIGDWQ